MPEFGNSPAIGAMTLRAVRSEESDVAIFSGMTSLAIERHFEWSNVWMTRCRRVTLRMQPHPMK